jgi:A/G-specific adenine glycosylase
LRVAEVVAARDGSPPETMAELLRLPGVGMYTSAAWLSLHRGKRAVIIDANVARWHSRVTGLPYNRDPRHVRWVKELADDLTPRRAFRQYNYAVLDFTMTICLPRNPRCDACPVLSECRYGQERLRAGELNKSASGQARSAPVVK